jgi:hypothetical protein
MWRMGVWALRVVNASGKKIDLVKRLTRHDAQLIGTTLRSAGFSVIAVDDLL